MTKSETVPLVRACAVGKRPAVEVHWKGHWYPPHVLAQRGGAYNTSYDEEGAEWNKWVASRGIRPHS